MSPKPLSDKYPKELKSLGDHIRKRRLDLGLFQKQVADRIGVDESTVFNWESNETSPQIHHIPRVVQFLGYDPFPTPETHADKLRKIRRRLGLNQRAMAERLGVDPTTLGRWERGEGLPSKRLSRVISRSLGYNLPKFN